MSIKNKLEKSRTTPHVVWMKDALYKVLPSVRGIIVLNNGAATDASKNEGM